ncbi:hypothetical protein Ancab_024383 [Ancistrocladus abbreviatus]
MSVDYNDFQGNILPLSSSSALSLNGVNYSCGSCGYELNLNSCSRNTSVIGSTYRKSMRKGIISFFSIDESRVTQIECLRLLPYFISIRSWGLFQRRTQLLCRKCGNHIGNACSTFNFSSDSLPREEPCLTSWDGISGRTTYNIRIRALQPSSNMLDLLSSSDTKTS